MSDSSRNESLARPQQSAHDGDDLRDETVEAMCDGEGIEDKDKIQVLSHDEVALALWQWSKEIFREDAHIMYAQICERLNIPDKTSKQIRRRSMPVITNLTSILKPNDENDIVDAIETPRQRPRASTFSVEPHAGITKSIMELSPDAPMVDVSFRAPTTARQHSALCDPPISSPPMTGPGFQQPAYMMTTLMQYGEPPAVPARSPLRDTQYDGPSISPMQHSSHGQRLPLATSQLRQEDAQILQSAIDRGLISAERLDPDQCQQLLAAQQRARHRVPTYSPFGPQAQEYHPSRRHMHSGPHASPLPPQQRPPQYYRQSPQYSDQRQHTDPIHLGGSTSSSSTRNSSSHSGAVVPLPLHSRPPLEQRGSTFDANRSSSRRVQWVQDQSRAQRAKEANRQDVLRHAGLIEEHRACKRLQEQREEQQQAQQQAAQRLMRSGSMQHYFRKGMRELQAKATFG